MSVAADAARRACVQGANVTEKNYSVEWSDAEDALWDALDAGGFDDHSPVGLRIKAALASLGSVFGALLLDYHAERDRK